MCPNYVEPEHFLFARTISKKTGCPSALFQPYFTTEPPQRNVRFFGSRSGMAVALSVPILYNSFDGRSPQRAPGQVSLFSEGPDGAPLQGSRQIHLPPYGRQNRKHQNRRNVLC